MNCRYCCKIERPDGSTYEQSYNEFEDLLYIRSIIGEDYLIVDVY